MKYFDFPFLFLCYSQRVCKSCGYLADVEKPVFTSNPKSPTSSLDSRTSISPDSFKRVSAGMPTDASKRLSLGRQVSTGKERNSSTSSGDTDGDGTGKKAPEPVTSKQWICLYCSECQEVSKSMMTDYIKPVLCPGYCECTQLCSVTLLAHLYLKS